MDDGIRALLARMPEDVKRFDHTEWPLPLAWAFLGGPPEPARLCGALLEHADDDIKQSLEPALMAAELVAAADPEAKERFITDNRARTYSFRGAKWRAGWVCLVGDGHHAELARRFKQDRWLVFSPLSGRGGPLNRRTLMSSSASAIRPSSTSCN